MLTWNNAPSVSCCGPFVSGSEAGSTIDHPRQLYQAVTCTHIASRLHMYHLSVPLSVELANADTTQEVHYWADTKNQSDYWCHHHI